MQSIGKFPHMVEDRDTGYIFETPSEAPAGTPEFEIFLDGVEREDMYDESKALWLMKEDKNAFVIVPQDTFDHGGADYDVVGFPVPVPIQYNAEEYTEYHGHSL